MRRNGRSRIDGRVIGAVYGKTGRKKVSSGIEPAEF